MQPTGSAFIVTAAHSSKMECLSSQPNAISLWSCPTKRSPEEVHHSLDIPLVRQGTLMKPGTSKMISPKWPVLHGPIGMRGEQLLERETWRLQTWSFAVVTFCQHSGLERKAGASQCQSLAGMYEICETSLLMPAVHVINRLRATMRSSTRLVGGACVRPGHRSSADTTPLRAASGDHARAAPGDREGSTSWNTGWNDPPHSNDKPTEYPARGNDNGRSWTTNVGVCGIFRLYGRL